MHIEVRHSDKPTLSACGFAHFDLGDFNDEAHEDDDGTPFDGEALACELVTEEKLTERDWIMEIDISEANYAMTDNREQVARMGVPFLGCHGAGGSYGPMVFAAWEGEMIEITEIQDVGIAVSVDWETGEPAEQEIAWVKEYITLRKKVEALFVPLKKEQE